MKRIYLIIISLLFMCRLSAQIDLNTNFDILSNQPIDNRTVIDNLSDTTSAIWVYEGLSSYVKGLNEFYIYNGSFWEPLSISNGLLDSVNLSTNYRRDTAIANVRSEMAIGSGTLDDAYNNIGANPATITIDGSEGQTGGGITYSLQNNENFLVKYQSDAYPALSVDSEGHIGMGTGTNSPGKLNIYNRATDSTRWVVDIIQERTGVASGGMKITSASENEPPFYAQMFTDSTRFSVTQLGHWQSGLGSNYFYRKALPAYTSSPLGYFYQAETTDDQPALKIKNLGVGNTIETDYFIEDSDGNIGIGSNLVEAVSALTIREDGIDAADDAAASNFPLMLHSDGVSAGEETGLGFSLFASGGDLSDTYSPWAAITAEKFSSGAKLHFKTKLSGNLDLNTGMTIEDTGEVGIGTTSPEGKLHVFSSDAGTVSPWSNANDIVIESSGQTGLSLLSPDANNTTLSFGSPSDNDYAYIQGFYTAGAPQLRFNVGGTNGIVLRESGNVEVRGVLDMTGGSTGALRLPRMTTAQRDATTPLEGWQIHNAETNRPNYYDGTEWLSHIRVNNDGDAFFSGSAGFPTETPSGVQIAITGSYIVGPSNTNLTLKPQTSRLVNILNSTNNNSIAIFGNDAAMFNENLSDHDFKINWDDADAFFVEGSSGNVGVGIVTPNEKLHIYNAANDDVSLHLENDFSGKNSIFKLNSGSSGDGLIQFAEANTIQAMIKYDGGTDLLYINNGALGADKHVVIDGTGNVGMGTDTPETSAILDLNSTTKGFLVPRMTTTERNLITATAGLIIFNTTTSKHQGYDGTAWNDFY